MKRVLVTGGNSGIGYATAGLFKQRGYDVTICGRSSQRVAEAAGNLGVEGIVADISNPDHIEILAACFSGGGLDVLVNNAAIARFMPITAHTLADYNEFLNVNIRGPLLLIQKLVPALAKKRGVIVNVSSVITNNGLPNASLYAATKGAVDGFTRSLSLELAPQGIRVNCVSPGAVDTPLIGKLGLKPEQINEIKAHQETVIPLGRYAISEEIAQVILSQAESTYVTGSIWTVDGGVGAT